MSLDVRAVVRRDDFVLDVALTVASGEVVAVVGPNGAGKSTLLRAVAGLLAIDDGHVRVGDRTVADVPARIAVAAADRRVGVVFQDHRLFPHLSAVENVAFGPRARGVAAADARATARDWLARVGLTHRADARPSELSGGQSQRVALARALATDPGVLLLDEPLAALDVDTRTDVRRLLRTHLADFDGPTLLVTHDPVEALTLADRLVVIEDGRITQVGAPAEVTARPRSRWVAELVGLNLLRGVADGTKVRLHDGTQVQTADPATGPVAVVVHPRAVAVHRQRPEGSPRNVFVGEVADLDVRGDHVRVRVDGAVPLVAEVTPAAVAELDLGLGGPVHLAVKATELAVHPDDRHPDPSGPVGSSSTFRDRTRP